jgi:hypothetical protein
MRTRVSNLAPHAAPRLRNPQDSDGSNLKAAARSLQRRNLKI